MKGIAEKLIEFAEEQDVDKAYTLLNDSLDMGWPKQIEDYDNLDWVGPLVDTLRKGPKRLKNLLNTEQSEMSEVPKYSTFYDYIPLIWIEDDTSLYSVIEEAQKIIREIIRSEYITTHILEPVVDYVMVVQDGGKIRPRIHIKGWPFKADDIVFAFVMHLERSDHARCENCSKLFIGTRKGKRRFCKDSCRVTSFNKKKAKGRKK